jgi:hypothetical protein
MPAEPCTQPESATIELTPEEAYALLLMCMMSPMKLDPTAEAALRKIADACRKLDSEPTRDE